MNEDAELERVVTSQSKEIRRLSHELADAREKVQKLLAELHEFQCADCGHRALDCAGQYCNRDDQPEDF